MNNFLTELLNRNTDNLQIHYYENINIYTDSTSRSNRSTGRNINNLSNRIPVSPRVVNSNMTRNSRTRNINRNNSIRTQNPTRNERTKTKMKIHMRNS